MQSGSKSVDTGVCCPTGTREELGEIGLLGTGAHSVSVTCCPIEIGEIEEIETLPHDTANKGEHSGEAVRPLALEGNKSQENVQQQSRPELKDVGSAISVYNEEFLKDTGATNNESLLVYATNTEVGGPQGSFAGLGDGGQLTEGGSLIRPNNNTRVRGLTSADTTRNLILSDIPWDSYNTSRIDLQRGANSILYGLGSPAGIINATLDSAVFAESNEDELRIGSHGITRGSFNVTQIL
jgi:outer membrane receptor protein involved in Fe transport